MHKFEEFNDETLGLIAKINDYEAFWGTNGTMHYIKFCRGGKVARFSVFTGKQIIVDSQYIEVPQKVFNALQKVTSQYFIPDISVVVTFCKALNTF